MFPIKFCTIYKKKATLAIIFRQMSGHQIFLDITTVILE